MSFQSEIRNVLMNIFGIIRMVLENSKIASGNPLKENLLWLT